MVSFKFMYYYRRRLFLGLKRSGEPCAYGIQKSTWDLCLIFGCLREREHDGKDTQSKEFISLFILVTRAIS